MLCNYTTFKFIFINLIIFDKWYYDFTMVSINLSNVIAILANGDCPFLGLSCFKLKWFALLGGCNIFISGASHVPFWGFLVFNLNVLPFWGDATLCAFSRHARMHKWMTPYMLTKKWKKSPCQICQILSFYYHFVII